MRNLIIGLVLASALPAAAQQRDMLEGQPAVRHRRELRAGRFELGPMLGFTFLEPYKHTVVGGLKADYHLNDWLSLGVLGLAGVASLDTGLTGEIAETEAVQIRDNCGPNASQQCRARFEIADEDGVRWEDAQNSLKYAVALRATVTPFAGKLALFSRLFSAYDIYVFGGLGVLGFKNDAGASPPQSCGTDMDGNPVPCDADLGNDGLSIGGHVGLGLHLFLGEFVTVNYEFIDNLAANNPSGRNTNESASAANLVDGDDKRFGNNMMMLFGATFYFPTEVARTK